eukprot:Seg2164.6 transcript_id=Seg2164.6/GoldUCD/mRNA.D3Y31 product="hypothetical protein" protein_id=Seg2164.6/GoldUCD/D3Y31
MSYLLQHLEGEARRAVMGYSRDKFGYVRALKSLKYLFGQPSRVAQAHLSKAVRRLPFRLQERWCEHSLKIRRQEEPNLQHLEEWLQDRVLASMDPYMPSIQSDRQQRSSRPSHNSKPNSRSKLTTLATMTTEVKETHGRTKGSETPSLCALCSAKHKIFRCNSYATKSVSERRKLVKEKKLCFNCLNSDYMARTCPSQYTCRECSKRHHSSLHEHSEQNRGSSLHTKNKSNSAGHSNSETRVATKQGNVNSPGYGTDDSTIVGMMTSKLQRVFLQIVEVEVQSKDGRRLKTHALLESGSQATLVKEDFAKRLSLTGIQQTVHVRSIKEEGEPLLVERVSFRISPTDGKCTFDVNNAYVMPRSKFNTPSQRLPTSFRIDPKYKYLHGLKLCDVSAKDVDLLIGADIPEALIASQVQREPPGQPFAVETPLGWTLLGVADGGAKSARIQLDFNHMQDWKDDELHSRVEEFWQTEAFGTKSNLPNPFSPEDESVLKNMDATTNIVDGHYEVGMLWKQSTIQLPNNYVMAERRFKSLIKRFKADQSLHRHDSETIESYVN